MVVSFVAQCTYLNACSYYMVKHFFKVNRENLEKIRREFGNAPWNRDFDIPGVG